MQLLALAQTFHGASGLGIHSHATFGFGTKISRSFWSRHTDPNAAFGFGTKISWGFWPRHTDSCSNWLWHNDFTRRLSEAYRVMPLLALAQRFHEAFGLDIHAAFGFGTKISRDFRPMHTDPCHNDAIDQQCNWQWHQCAIDNGISTHSLFHLQACDDLWLPDYSLAIHTDWTLPNWTDWIFVRITARYEVKSEQYLMVDLVLGGQSSMFTLALIDRCERWSGIEVILADYVVTECTQGDCKDVWRRCDHPAFIRSVIAYSIPVIWTIDTL